MRCLLTRLVVVACATLITAPAGAEVIVIDDFTSVESPDLWPFVADETTLSRFQQEDGLAGVLLGGRDSSLRTGAGGPGMLRADIDTALGVYTFDVVGQLPGSASLDYVFITEVPTPADLPVFDGYSGIAVEIGDVSAGPGGVEVAVRLSVPPFPGDSGFVDIEAVQTTTGNETLFFSFDDFDDDGCVGCMFQTRGPVAQLSVILRGLGEEFFGDGESVEVLSVSVVPSGWAMPGLVLLAAGFGPCGRRRRGARGVFAQG